MANYDENQRIAKEEVMTAFKEGLLLPLLTSRREVCMNGEDGTIWLTVSSIMSYLPFSAAATFNQLFSSVVSQNSSFCNHRGACEKCKLLGPIWDLQNQKSWEWDPEICIWTSCPNDSCAYWSLRIVGLKYKSYFINTWITLGCALYLGEQLTGAQHRFLTLAHL